MCELEKRVEQLEKCVSVNFEKDPIGIGKEQWFWTKNLARWVMITVDQITIFEDRHSSVTGLDKDGERHHVRSFDLFTTRAENEASAIYKARIES